MRKAALGLLGVALGAAAAARAEYTWTYFVEGDALVSEWQRTAAREPAPIAIPEPSAALVFAGALLTIRRAARCARSC